jgi:hypothetical protein
MKLLYTAVFTLFTICSQAQHYLTTGLSWGNPGDEMADNIGSLQNVSAGYMYRLPGCLNRFSIGAEVSFGLYGDAEKLQTFNFPGGGSTQTWVYYSSQASQTSVTGKFNIVNGKFFTPYINGKLGYALFFSTIFVEDPHDEDGCKPLQQKNLIRDGTMMTAYGGGIQMNIGIFDKYKKPRNSWIDLSINKIKGGSLDYINTKRLIDAGSPPVGSDGKAVNVRFINATTQEIHEHQVAEVYTTPLNMLDIKLSYYFRIGKRG